MQPFFSLIDAPAMPNGTFESGCEAATGRSFGVAPEPGTNFTVDIEPFDPARHDRTVFSCGSDRIDNYLKRTAKKHQKDDFARVFVAVAPGETGILGYYAINAHGVEAQDLPTTLSRKAPRHGYVPAAYLSIVGVDRRVQGQGLGQALLGVCAVEKFGGTSLP